MKKLFKKKTFLDLLGPGFITGAADDDPSGIATYSQAGAQFGMRLLWLAPLTFPLMAIIQEMCARIGIVTGRGLAANIRRVFPRPIVMFLVFMLVIANTINIGADLGAMVASILLLFPQSSFLLVLAAVTVVSLALQVFLPYHLYARYLKWLAFVLVFYALSALSVPNIDWNEVFRNTVVPHISEGAIVVIVAILGTTISPYLFFWQTSQEVEEEIDQGERSIRARILAVSDRSLSAMRVDVWIGMFFSNVVMFFIILATAVTLFRSNITEIETAGQAASALRPFVGDLSYIVFTIGIIGTGLLAVPVLAGSSAYAVSEAFKKKEGLSKKWYQATLFYAVIGLSMVIGFGMNLLSINPIHALLASAIVNALVAPFIVAAIVLLSNNRKVMGKYANNRLTSLLGWGLVALMGVAGVVAIVTLIV